MQLQLYLVCFQFPTSYNPELTPILTVTPFDVVKTRLQAQRDTPLPDRNSSIRFTSTPVSDTTLSSYLGLIFFCFVFLNINFQHAFTQIFRREGLSSLWRGLPASLLMTVPAAALYVEFYIFFKSFYRID